MIEGGKGCKKIIKIKDKGREGKDEKNIDGKCEFERPFWERKWDMMMMIKKNLNLINFPESHTYLRSKAEGHSDKCK